MSRTISESRSALVQFAGQLKSWLLGARSAKVGCDKVVINITPTVAEKATETATENKLRIRGMAASTTEVLPRLGTQLRDVARDLEQSVVEVCGGFQGIGKRSREVVQLAESAIAGDGGQESVNSLIDGVHEVLNRLLANSHSSCEFVNVQSQRIQDLASQIQQVQLSLQEVEEISCRAKLVALNGQIEAARLGEVGRAFCVVVEETKKLAGNARNTSNNIREQIARLEQTLHSTTSELVARSARDSASLAESQSDVNVMLDKLHRANAEMIESLSSTNDVSKLIQRDIGQSVMAMQFQDRLNQRIDHVIESLDWLATELRPIREETSQAEIEACVAKWSDWFNARSTMDAERDSQASSTSVTASNANECTVELF